MQPHLSDLQFFIGIAALALAGFLFLAAIFDLRRTRKSARFLNDFPYDDQSHAYHRGQ